MSPSLGEEMPICKEADPSDLPFSLWVISIVQTVPLSSLLPCLTGNLGSWRMSPTTHFGTTKMMCIIVLHPLLQIHPSVPSASGEVLQATIQATGSL